MSASHTEQFEHLIARYREQYEALRETQQRLREISCTATAPRQAVSVTAGHGGVIKDVKFPTGAYKRMAPNELAAAVLGAITEAQNLATAEAAEAVAPSLPEGVDARRLFAGEVDLQTLLAPEPHLSDTVRDVLKIRD
ncbi:YbaB/EbfC family nucleoid-associated protein [Allokutzneria albata]|uniref:YbaB/EbfC DNA-binding family protein n=1 Tax=Allokutzneria albata TaxID=211114 RepID=A0A1G9WBC2_ALLAB|nr:YbaB/EbfC family nucleoid-associated protein [Allokutzneria albata]SDM81315.1 YbaB/EbfC DNA-binding family protein [Allokutzneria albata]